MKKITTLLLMLIAPMIMGHTTFDDSASASEEIVIGNCDVQCPDDIEVTADANDEFTIPDYVANGTVTVTCDGGTITQNPAPGTIVGPGTTVITITAVNATDDDDCDFDLIVNGNGGGNCEVECPNDDVTVAANDNDEYIIPNYIANGTVTINCTNGTVSQTPAPGTIVGVGTTEILIEAANATDDDDCDFDLIVTGTTGGGDCEVECPDEDVIVAADNNNVYVVPDFVADGIVIVNCSGGNITQIPAPGTEIGLGTIEVVIEASTANDDDDCDFDLVVEESLGVGSSEIESLVLFPNPARSKITVSIPIIKITIYDLMGRIRMAEEHQIVDVSTLKHGLYYVQIETEHGSTIKKLMID